MAAKYDEQLKLNAETLYFQGMSVPEIVRQLGINNVRIVYKWADKEGWDNWATPERVIATLSRRLIYLTEKNKKTGLDLQELDIVGNQLQKLTGVKDPKLAEPKTSKEAKTDERERKKKLKNNDVSELTAEQFKEFIDAHFYEYQKIIYAAGLNPLTRAVRMILKPRQAGGSWMLAVEAFEDAVLTGNNQAFISATKRQAEVFKSYIINIARQYFNVTLTGSPMRLSNGAELHFLSPNSNAQSFCANVYFDEYAWCGKFDKMEEVAGAMATRGILKTTYMSTPSSISHESYEYWTGERFNKFLPDADKVDIDISSKKGHKELKRGRLDPDGFWRMRFTIHDAYEMGLSEEEVSLAKIKIKNPDPAVFACLYECKFVDDTASVFTLNEILACATDTQIWVDINKDAPRPYGNGEVTAGYEPAGVGDNSSFEIMTRPKNKREKFRLIENNNWRGVPTNVQCQYVEDRTKRYNITYMEIDNTGPGAFLADFVQHIYPDMVRRNYSPDQKTRMVQKGKQIFADERFEYDENDKTLPLAFMTIKQKITPQSNQITYYSTRTKKAGHGDMAWGCLQAFSCEAPFSEYERETSVTFFE